MNQYFRTGEDQALQLQQPGVRQNHRRTAKDRRYQKACHLVAAGREDSHGGRAVRTALQSCIHLRRNEKSCRKPTTPQCSICCPKGRQGCAEDSQKSFSLPRKTSPPSLPDTCGALPINELGGSIRSSYPSRALSHRASSSTRDSSPRRRWTRDCRAARTARPP